MEYEKIIDDLELCKFNGVTATSVYVGGLGNLYPTPLEWRKEKYEELGTIELLKLSEIVKQLNESIIITVFIKTPIRGEILQYRNYDHIWYKIGETCGYA